MPAVTNFRVSFDFCYGNSWNIGTSSLLVWALGAAPSKDTLWTTTNNRTAVPGCDWTPDHEAPAVETHVVLALLTTGPVGISDGLGFTDAPLIQRTISADGTLLQPCRAATLVDSLFVARAAGDAASAEIYGTYSAGVCKPDEPPCAYYVMIRDPLARMMSEYATRERLGCRIFHRI